MYYDYFGFRQPPFRITPDTRLFFPGGERGAVLEALLYAILNGEGIVKVVGEVGSGKTMLCRMLEKELPDRVEVVYLANPSLAPENTVHAIAFELNLDIPAGASRFEIMNRLQEYLLERHGRGRQVVVFVEEAQSMPLATLEEIRLLSNLETQQNKLLQIVLFGQPELDVMIASPGIRQLRERITYSFSLNPFQSDDIRDYLNSRVRACGYRADTLFDKAAIQHIEYYSRGLLRRINILADKALLAAFAENRRLVTAAHVKKAAADSEFTAAPGRYWRRPAWLAAGLAALGFAAVSAAWLAKTGAHDGQQPGTAEIAVAEGEDGGEDGQERQLESGDQDIRAVPGKAAGRLAEPVENVEETETGETTAGVGTEAKGSPMGEAPGARTGGDPGAVLAGPGERLYRVIETGVFDGAGFSDTGAETLRGQLQAMPPETVVLSEGRYGEAICERCRSIIYRPLKRVENL